jgi:hypothetical protein
VGDAAGIILRKCGVTAGGCFDSYGRAGFFRDQGPWKQIAQSDYIAARHRRIRTHRAKAEVKGKWRISDAVERHPGGCRLHLELARLVGTAAAVKRWSAG